MEIGLEEVLLAQVGGTNSLLGLSAQFPNHNNKKERSVNHALSLSYKTLKSGLGYKKGSKIPPNNL